MKDSLFQNCSHPSDGCGIYASGDFPLLVESSTFIGCKATSGSGGWIYKNSGQYVVAKSCSVGCTSAGYAHFICSEVYDRRTNKNELHEFSVTVSVASGSTTIRLLYGTVNITSVNCMGNECPAFYCEPSQGANTETVTCSISYSHIEDNTATEDNCIYLTYPPRNSNNQNQLIEHTNIVNNSQNTKIYGLIHAVGVKTTLNDCVIIRNNEADPFVQSSEKYEYRQLHPPIISQRRRHGLPMSI